MSTVDFLCGFQCEEDTVAIIRPPQRMRTWDWVKEYGRTPDGKPFNWRDYPWTQGICDEWDNPRRDTIWLQFAARLGKTLIAHQLLVSAVARRPAPTLYGATTESFVKQTVLKKIYPMLEECDETRGHLRPAHKRLQTRIDLRHCTIYTAWSGSPTTLADLDPHYKHAGEIDKWDKSESDEADPLDLFLERGREVPDRKTICESTPTITGRSRVEKGLARGTNCRFHVPCPNCGTFQELSDPVWDERKGWEFPDSSLIFDVDKENRATADQAYHTARYRCGACKHEFFDVDRKPAIRRGVWVPQGCTANKRGKVVGDQLNDGPEASFQLARIYAPTFTFGDIGRGLVDSTRDDEARQNYLNSWRGVTFQRKRTEEEWDEVAARLCDDSFALRSVPEDTLFLTCGIDVQMSHFVYVVYAWDADARGSLVDYGEADTWQDVEELLDSKYQDWHISMTLIDARDGNKTEEVIENCERMHRQFRRVLPSMGAVAGHMSGKSFLKKNLDDMKNIRRRAARNDFSVITVNTGYWQTWIHNALYRRDWRREDKSTLRMPGQVFDDQDFWEQLINEAPDDKETSTGHTSVQYIVVNSSIPWDFRDATRYARCGAEVFTNRAWARAKRQLRSKEIGGRARQKERPKVREKFIAPSKKIGRREYRS